MAAGWYGTIWRDARAWRALCDGSECPICREGRPRDAIADLSVSWAVAGREAPLPGYATVVSKRHVVEPFELPPGERAAFWEDVMLVARALANVFRPIKMNYEIHGNTIPHLHVHLYPRSPDDPFVGGPIDPRRASTTRTAEDLERIRTAIERIHR